MKKIYEGVLFIAFLLVAMYGVGGANDGSSVFLSAFAMAVIGVLMHKAGMMDEVLKGGQTNKTK